MKVLLYTDCHYSQTSSIVRKRGDKYSQRLENLLKSINWAEGLALEQGCDQVICLGDFFDKPVLNDEELTALEDIKWNSLPHTFIVGNHESSVNGLRYNSVNALRKNGFNIISQAESVIVDDKTAFHFIPYTIETDRKPLGQTIVVDPARRNIVFSHNDIKGIQYGMFLSEIGYSLDEIEANCDLFINGHLHNGSFLNDKETILNLGNLTGQNFSEDAFNYPHYACILDTDKMDLSAGLQFFENPYAFNFYKIELKSEKDLQKLTRVKDNAVVSIKCSDDYVLAVKDFLKDKSYADYRITGLAVDKIEDNEQEIELTTTNYLQQFKDYMLTNIDNSSIMEEELYHVIGGEQDDI